MTPPTRQLGRNGPEVTAIDLGMMSLTGAYGQQNGAEEKLALLDHAHAIGERFWNTADVHLGNESFKRNPKKRKDIFLAAKFALSYDFQTMEQFVDSSPEYVKKACEESLKKLGVEMIDLFYCHRIDGKTPIEKTVQAMVEFKNEDKIRYIGLSEVSAQTLRRACKVHQIAAHQIEYNPFTLEFERQIIPVAWELGIATVAYSPIGRGFLTGQIKKLEELPDFHRNTLKYSPENFPKIMDLVTKFEEVAKAHGKSPAQICLAWLLAQGDDGIPIPGTRGQKYLDENTSAADIKLSDAEVKALREAADATVLSVTRCPEMSREMWASVLIGETPKL